MDDDASPTTRARASTVAVVTRRRSFTHEARQEAEAALRAACESFVVPENYDYSTHTSSNYGGGAENVGRFRDVRNGLDTAYHGTYTEARQLLQDKMIESVVAFGEAQRHPWLIYTAGAMGAGKSRTIGWMSEQGYFPLSQIVHLDPDMFKTHFPEWQGYLSSAMCEAGSRTRRESGYLVEIAQQAAMAARKHVWVDGSLRDGEWYASELQRVREAHPGYRLAIVYVKADDDVVLERVRRRAEMTGRAVPEAEVRDSLARVPKSVEVLCPLVDFLAVIDNTSDDAPELKKYCDADACYLRPDAWSEIENRFRSVPEESLGRYRRAKTEEVLPRDSRASHFDVDLSARASAAAPISPALKPAGGALLVLQLGATNDAAGAVDADVVARCARTREHHDEATRNGWAVRVLPSGGIQANFNPTTTAHWKHVSAALAAAGVPAASIVEPGLPALHTVDEAIMARAHVLALAPAERPAELIVVTSDYHAPRSAHLFGVAFGPHCGCALPHRLVVVPAALDADVVAARRAHEASALAKLKSSPYDPWLGFLKEHGLSPSGEKA